MEHPAGVEPAPSGFEDQRTLRYTTDAKLAQEGGFEPPSYRLTAGRFAVETTPEQMVQVEGLGPSSNRLKGGGSTLSYACISLIFCPPSTAARLRPPKRSANRQRQNTRASH